MGYGCSNTPKNGTGGDDGVGVKAVALSLIVVAAVTEIPVIASSLEKWRI